MKNWTNTTLIVDRVSAQHTIKGLQVAMQECLQEINTLTCGYYSWHSPFTKAQRADIVKVVKLGEQIANLEAAISSIEDEFELNQEVQP